MMYHADRFIRGRHAFYRFIPTFRYFFLCYPKISVSNYGTDWFYLLLFYLLLSCTQDMSSVISELQRIAKKFFDWCRNDHMKANPEKCHVLLSSYTQEEIRFANASIASSLNEKLFWITLDS